MNRFKACDTSHGAGDLKIVDILSTIPTPRLRHAVDIALRCQKFC